MEVKPCPDMHRALHTLTLRVGDRVVLVMDRVRVRVSRVRGRVRVIVKYASGMTQPRPEGRLG